MKNIAVIGAGAAGMMAAIAAAQNGAAVTVYEKNEKAGKKIYITGKGRCNVTNNAETEDYFGNICRNRKFLYSATYDFDHTQLMDFFEQNGCPLKVERGDRVFPVSDHSSDIIAALLRAMQKLHIKICYRSEITAVEYKDDHVCSITVNHKEKVSVDALIVCTGGMSYDSTGSTGDGYRFARKAGHSLTEPSPSLVPLVIKEDWCKELQGLSLRNVSVRMIEAEEKTESEEKSGNEAKSETEVKSGNEEKGKKKSKKKNRAVYDGFGEMLFTHFGVSGPLILSASTCYEEGRTYILHLDLKPALTKEQLDNRLLRDFEAGNKKEFRNILGGLFPSKLIPIMVELSGIDPSKKVSEVSHEERERLIDLTKDLTMTVTGTRGFNEAIITKGGINVKEINPSTMESRFRKGLYFAGEVLDVDAVTGGFNLQIAWSTGHLAGSSAALDDTDI